MKVTLFVLALFALSGCVPTEDPARRSGGMFIADGAANVHYAPADGLESMSYEAPVPYPAARLIADIEASLLKLGYSRVPGGPAFRWTTVEKPPSSVDQWSGMWRSADGTTVAEYILEYRGNRQGPVYVRGELGASSAQAAQTATAVATAPPPEEPSLEPVEIQENQAALLCGADGAALVRFTSAGITSAEAHWRFRSRGGREDRGTRQVREKRGSARGVIDASEARFAAGPYQLSWSPGTTVMQGDDAPCTTEEALAGDVVSATSYLYPPAGLRVRLMDVEEFARLDLLTACR